MSKYRVLLWIALVAALLALVTAAMAERAVVPIPERPPITVPAIPANAVLLYQADPKCPPSIETITLPALPVRDCLMRESRLAAVRIVLRDHIDPANDSPCWAFMDPRMYANCLDVAARQLPSVSYGLSARYVTGFLAGAPWQGCAAGISDRPIFVSLAEPGRVNSLLCWEAANSWLIDTMHRRDLTDGPVTAEATSAALTACGF